MTSRAIKGNVTMIVAMTMPGQEKMIFHPKLLITLPKTPWLGL